MNNFCINHSFSEAHWYCKKCKVSYCFSCVKKKDFKFSKEEAVMHVCPSCKRPVEWTGINAISGNFLKVSGKAIAYPVSALSMLMIAFMACLSMLFTQNVYLNEILFVFIWSLTASYAQDVLEHTLQGENEPPHFLSIPFHKLTDHVMKVFKQSMLLLFAALIFFGVMQLDSALFGFCVLCLFSVIFPMGLMKSITTRTFKSFFDLSKLGSTLKRCGTLYLVLAALLMPVIAIFHLYTIIDPRIVTPCLCFLLIVIYRLLGHMILKAHKELNYSLNYEDFKKQYSLETLHGFKA